MTYGVVVAVEQLRRTVPGGVGRYAAGLLTGLRVAAPASPVSLLASRHLGKGPDPLATFGFDLTTSWIPAPLLTAAWDRGLAFAPRDAGVVHAVSLASPRLHPLARRGAKLAVTVHDLAWRTHPEATTARGRRWHESALARALEHADGFVVPSTPVADALVGAGADRSAVHTIPHGVDHLPPEDRDGADALLRRLGVGDGYLLAAGTREPRKNLARLGAAYEAARSSLPGAWPLVVVGPQGWGDVGSREIRGVLAAGKVDDAVLVALYRGARAFAYVPLEEGFGLPPVEAMACGAPVVVSTTVPSTSESEDAAVALRVDPESIDAIADALVRASQDGPLRDGLIARGAAHVRTLTWESSARAHVAWWSALACG